MPGKIGINMRPHTLGKRSGGGSQRLADDSSPPHSPKRTKTDSGPIEMDALTWESTQSLLPMDELESLSLNKSLDLTPSMHDVLSSLDESSVKLENPKDLMDTLTSSMKNVLNINSAESEGRSLVPMTGSLKEILGLEKEMTDKDILSLEELEKIAHSHEKAEVKDLAVRRLEDQTFEEAAPKEVKRVNSFERIKKWNDARTASSEEREKAAASEAVKAKKKWNPLHSMGNSVKKFFKRMGSRRSVKFNLPNNAGSTGSGRNQGGNRAKRRLTNQNSSDGLDKAEDVMNVRSVNDADLFS